MKLFAQCKGIDCSLQKPPGLVILRVQEINLGYRQIAVQYSVQIMSLMPEKKIYVLGTSRNITPEKCEGETMRLRLYGECIAVKKKDLRPKCVEERVVLHQSTQR